MRSGSLTRVSMKVTQHLVAQVQLLLYRTIGFMLHFDTFTEIALHFGVIIMHATTNERAIATESYSRFTATKSPSLYITTFSVPYDPPTSVTWLQLLRTQINAGTSTTLISGTQWFTRTRLRALSRLGSPALPAPEAGDIMGLILL